MEENNNPTGTTSGVASGTTGVGAATGSANSDNAISALGGNHGDTTSGMGAGVASILERFGISENQLNTVRETLKNVNLEESLDRAKEQVSDSISKAREYARQNPGAVAAGLAVLVIGAGLIAGAAMRKDKE